jgi:hypothetical protein
VAVPFPTCTTTVKVPEALDPELGKSDSVQVMLPVDAPTAGVAQVQPAAGTMDWNVVFAGIPSLNTALTASSGPLFVTVWVYVMLPPGATMEGEPELVTDRLALAQ